MFYNFNASQNFSLIRDYFNIITTDKCDVIAQYYHVVLPLKVHNVTLHYDINSANVVGYYIRYIDISSLRE